MSQYSCETQSSFIRDVVKGQLISKCPSGVFQSTKKNMLIMLNSPLISNKELSNIIRNNNVPLSFNLESRAEIHQIFALVFWKIEDAKKSF